jgi:hypothetical protein
MTDVQPGIMGIFATCPLNKEKLCGRELLLLLNEVIGSELMVLVCGSFPWSFGW